MTGRAAQELLGAQTIDGWSAQPGGGGRDGGGGVKKVKYAFKATRNVREQCQRGQFPTLFAQKITENAVFYLKVLPRHFLRKTIMLNFVLLKALFWKSYSPSLPD